MLSDPPGPLLSVITVSFRDPQGLRDTLTSLADHPLGAEVEFVIVDGGTVGTAFEAVRRDFPNASWVSEPDAGIYDAMNKGIDRARGRYLWFLNGGDLSAVRDWQGLRGELTKDDAIIMGNYTLASSEQSVDRKARSARYLWHALPTSHQAILYPRALVGTTRYDLSYPVSADYAFTLAVTRHGADVRLINATLARFGVGGVSTVHRRQIAVDAVRAQREFLPRPHLLSPLSFVLHRLSTWRRARFL